MLSALISSLNIPLGSILHMLALDLLSLSVPFPALDFFLSHQLFIKVLGSLFQSLSASTPIVTVYFHWSLPSAPFCSLSVVKHKPSQTVEWAESYI